MARWLLALVGVVVVAAVVWGILPQRVKMSIELAARRAAPS
jgi:hypothetical protein